ncbi:MAG: Membrane protein [Microbacteriaceae bacterium]|nr:Membrane protein [Microbacteriaceae bacterium]
MAQRFLTGAIVRYRVTPWWVKVFIIWGLSRIVTTILLQLFAFWQADNPWTTAQPDYLSYAQLWDSTWYHIVAVSGYPSSLPHDAAGHVTQNAWAFLPAYPLLVRIFMLVTTLSWPIVSVVISFLFSLAAALMFYRLMRVTAPARAVMFSVVLFCFAPLSPILQVSYAESMYLFLLVLALYLLVRRHYVVLLPVIAIAALTRPSGLALALALGLHVIHRWFIRRRDPFTANEAVLSIGATLFALIMGFAWPITAWLVTGNINAYTDTELAWRSDYVGWQAGLAPFSSWLQAAGFWAGQWGIGVWAYVLLAVVIVGFALVLFLPAVRRLGADLRLWLVSYAVYLLAVFFPQSSTFRLLIPMFPLLGAVAQPVSRIYRVSLVVLMIAGQFGWLYICWWVNGYDWTPP